MYKETDPEAFLKSKTHSFDKEMKPFHTQQNSEGSCRTLHWSLWVHDLPARLEGQEKERSKDLMVDFRKTQNTINLLLEAHPSKLSAQT